MGHMPPNYFFNAKSWNAKYKCNIESGTWPWIMCPQTLKRRLKPFVESFGAKHFCQIAFTIFKRPPKERRGEQAKAEINVFQFKVTSISRWKSSTKGGISTLENEWRKWKIPMVSSNGVIGVLEVSACIAQTYSPTWTRAPLWCNCAYRSGVGFGINSKLNIYECFNHVLLM